MFYISPFYHLVFPFEKFLVTDADIEFRYNINLLYSEFDKFGEDKLYAFAKDMSPLYRTLLFNYRYILVIGFLNKYSQSPKLIIAIVHCGMIGRPTPVLSWGSQGSCRG